MIRRIEIRDLPEIENFGMLFADKGTLGKYHKVNPAYLRTTLTNALRSHLFAGLISKDDKAQVNAFVAGFPYVHGGTGEYCWDVIAWCGKDGYGIKVLKDLYALNLPCQISLGVQMNRNLRGSKYLQEKLGLRPDTIIFVKECA
jgi:hypothetical protein